MWLGVRKVPQAVGFAFKMNVMDPAGRPNIKKLLCLECEEILWETPAMKQNSLREEISCIKERILKRRYFRRYFLCEDGSASYQNIP